MSQKDTKGEKRERFLRIAEYRVNQLLERIRTIGNLSNKSAYAYEEEDVRKIFAAAEQALKEARIKFRFTKNTKFKL